MAALHLLVLSLLCTLFGESSWLPVAFMIYYNIATRMLCFTQSICCLSVCPDSVPVSWGLCGGGLWHRGGGGSGLQTGLHLLQEKEWGRSLCQHRMVLQGQRRRGVCSRECNAASRLENLRRNRGAERCHALISQAGLQSSRHKLFIY